MSLSARDAFAMAGLVKRLKMSNVEKSRLLRWADDRSGLTLGLSDKDLKIEIYKAGRQVTLDRALLRAAGATDPIVRNSWLNIYKTAQGWQWPEFPLQGKDLIDCGNGGLGPNSVKHLDALKALWLRSGFNANKQALLSALMLINRE